MSLLKGIVEEVDVAEGDVGLLHEGKEDVLKYMLDVELTHKAERRHAIFTILHPDTACKFISSTANTTILWYFEVSQPTFTSREVR